MFNKQSLLIFVFRLGFGINFFLHGLGKLLGDQDAFRSSIVTKFSDTYLPNFLLEPYAYAIPYLELILGLFLVLGLFYYWSLIFSLLTMISLMIGMIAVQNWDVVTMHFIYMIYIFLLALNYQADKICLDYLFGLTVRR